MLPNRKIATVVINGDCACGAVRFTVTGAARRAGLCHCMTCRKAHAASFNPFVVFAREDFRVSGHVQEWQSSPGYIRCFCPNCGSRVFANSGKEVEISAGSFDEPGTYAPDYELWTKHREYWLHALPVPQYLENKPQPTAALTTTDAPGIV